MTVEIVCTAVGTGVWTTDTNTGRLVKKAMGGSLGVVSTCEFDWVSVSTEVAAVVAFDSFAMSKTWSGRDDDRSNVFDPVWCVCDVGAWTTVAYGCMWV